MRYLFRVTIGVNWELMSAAEMKQQCSDCLELDGRFGEQVGGTRSPRVASACEAEERAAVSLL